MRGLLLSLFYLVFLASCLSGSRAPLSVGQDGSTSENLLRGQVASLAKAISNEDVIALQNIFTSLFTVSPELAGRFRTTSQGGSGLDFFKQLFKENENINLEISPSKVEINGRVGVVTADTSLSAVYLLDVPPTTYQAQTTDILVFQIQDETWKLVSWTEKSTEEPKA